MRAPSIKVSRVLALPATHSKFYSEDVRSSGAVFITLTTIPEFLYIPTFIINARKGQDAILAESFLPCHPYRTRAQGYIYNRGVLPVVPRYAVAYKCMRFFLTPQFSTERASMSSACSEPNVAGTLVTNTCGAYLLPNLRHGPARSRYKHSRWSCCTW